jgi:hypothetical protein
LAVPLPSAPSPASPASPASDGATIGQHSCRPKTHSESTNAPSPASATRARIVTKPHPNAPSATSPASPASAASDGAAIG